MKASIVAASVALAGAAAAYEHKAHAGFHMRREYAKDEICTVYTTVYVSALPSMVANSTLHVQPSPGPSTPCSEEEQKHKTPVNLSTPVPEVPVPAPVTSVVVQATPSKPAEVYPPVPPKPETPKPESPKPAPPVYSMAPPVYSPGPAPSSSHAAEQPKPSGSYNSGGRIVTNGNKWAMTYTPYAQNGMCKTGDEIKTDIKRISEMGFTTIRSYSTDCGVFDYVVPACQEHGLKVIYGIFLEGAGKGPFSDYANAQLKEIASKAPKDSVAMVIVGNECMFNGHCEATQLASYIDYVRKELRSSGFPSDIAVTTTEPVGTWEQHGAALCDHIDVFAVQVHPYFTSSVSADQAGDFAAQQFAQAAKVCPGAAAKGHYITEIGWPKGGRPNGNAVANPENQKIAMKKILEKVGDQACVFSYQDDTWKHPGELGVEQYFGCSDAL